MKPIGKNIIIKTIEEEIKTASGLLLSSEDTNQLRYKKGVIIKSGTEVSVLKEGLFRRKTLLLSSKLIHFYYHVSIYFI